MKEVEAPDMEFVMIFKISRKSWCKFFERVFFFNIFIGV